MHRTFAALALALLAACSSSPTARTADPCAAVTGSMRLTHGRPVLVVETTTGVMWFYVDSDGHASYFTLTRSGSACTVTGPTALVPAT